MKYQFVNPEIATHTLEKDVDRPPTLCYHNRRYACGTDDNESFLTGIKSDPWSAITGRT